ncbi:hypothetical protein CAPTEDRAFT_102689 [Capitella teleta]|uniref:alpha-L-fucosidase n=1 Tax=Capitella teleta TaxID=283909 RepID=R7T726_CAPTE|nr:hypothetical protein CAPTEDRAFT_102689 [Capitella teleta]|eukprot:ELT89203.1 hypothetical protein CAPTEDRAFT_102689 [Capitella teleta]
MITGQVHYGPTWPSLDTSPLPKWYNEAKVGIFIHCVLFSVPSFKSEWFWYRWINDKNPTYIDFMKKNYELAFTYGGFANHFTAEFYDPNH